MIILLKLKLLIHVKLIFVFLSNYNKVLVLVLTGKRQCCYHQEELVIDSTKFKVYLHDEKIEKNN